MEMGLDESAMLYEFGLSEQDPFEADRAKPIQPPKEKKKVGPGHIMPKITLPQWPPPPPQPADEPIDLPEPDQSGMRYPKPKKTPPPPLPPLTKKQETELKAKLKEMDLDESAMLYEFGLSERDPAAADRAGRASGRREGGHP